MAVELSFLRRHPTVAVVRLAGMISRGARSLSDENMAPILERAFRRGRPVAVALLVNSPGGSPVQSSLIAARIRRLSQDRKVPVVAFVEDVAASGGYWLATAADEIWADESSILGSIGVIFASFGANRFLDRQGIERRVHTVGRAKSFMDPFLPERPEDVARLKALQEPIHEAFIAQVRERRGAKLAEADDLFTGDVWVGRQAVEKGLADGIGHLVPKMKERFGDKVRFIPYGRRRPLLQRLGGTVLGDVSEALEERALWSQFGL